ncbi:MAG: lysozyme, partial [Shewanella sp.]
FTKGVKKGDAITKGQADARLAHELDDFADGVKKLVKVPLKQCQLDALVSFAFNVGVGALRDSTLLKLLNAGNYAGAADQFTRWNKAGGKVLPGLVTRRAAEKEMFLSC